MGVALLLAQGSTALHPLLRVPDGPLHGVPARPQAEGGDHEARVPEDGLGLLEALALDAPDEPVGRHRHVLEEERRGVRGPDPVLVLRLAVGEPLGVPIHEEPAGSPGGVGEDRIAVGDAAVADPLLAAADAIRHHLAVLLDGLRLRGEGPEVAAGLRLGGPVSVELPLLGQLAQPLGLLLGCRPDVDGVGAQEGGQNASVAMPRSMAAMSSDTL